MGREIKLGIFAIITLIMMVWGYTFIKGQNLLESNKVFYTKYADVTQLATSSPVSINGFKVGAVTKIVLNPENVKEMLVYFNVQGDIDIPKNAVVLMKNEGVVGGKYLDVSFDQACTADCLPSGSFIEGKNVGLIGSMVNASEVNEYVSGISGELKKVIESLGTENSKGALNETLRNLEKLTGNLSELSNSMNNLVNANQKSLNGALSNVNKITENLAANNTQISKIIANLQQTTASLNSEGVPTKTAAFLEESKNTATALSKTLGQTNEVMVQLKSTMEQINSGDGTLTKLLNDKALYDNLEYATKNLGLLLQDFRLNPKRYVNVSLIGRKVNTYTVPEADPAFSEQKGN